MGRGTEPLRERCSQLVRIGAGPGDVAVRADQRAGTGLVFDGYAIFPRGNDFRADVASTAVEKPGAGGEGSLVAVTDSQAVTEFQHGAGGLRFTQHVAEHTPEGFGVRIGSN